MDLSAHHTFGLPSQCSDWVELRSLAQVRAAIAVMEQPPLILGEGSNSIFLTDCDQPVWHIALPGIDVLGADTDFHYIRVGAGVNWHAWVEWSLHHGYPGLENLALIPGSVGACPVQNIGAYGLEVDQRLHSVCYVDIKNGQSFELMAADCGFGYRDSRFKQDLAGRALITAVTFRLPRLWQPMMAYRDVAMMFDALPTSPWQVFDAVVDIRTRKLPDPWVHGNAGSFFKNPIVSGAQAQVLTQGHPAVPMYPQANGYFKVAAGWLIDQCGLKGYRVGDAGVSPVQALVLMNLGRATASDLRTLIAHVQDQVMDRFGIALEPEPNLYGA